MFSPSLFSMEGTMFDILVHFFAGLAWWQWLIPLVPVVLIEYAWLVWRYHDDYIAPTFSEKTCAVVFITSMVSALLAGTMLTVGGLLLIPTPKFPGLAPTIHTMWGVFMSYVSITCAMDLAVRLIVFPSIKRIAAAIERSDAAILGRIRSFIETELRDKNESFPEGSWINILQIRDRSLPCLLRQRRELKEKIAATKRDIAKLAALKQSSGFRQELSEHTLSWLAELQELLRQNESAINECLDYPDLMVECRRLEQVIGRRIKTPLEEVGRRLYNRVDHIVLAMVRLPGLIEKDMRQASTPSEPPAPPSGDAEPRPGDTPPQETGAKAVETASAPPTDAAPLPDSEPVQTLADKPAPA